ncbi:MAG: glycosyltransferase [Desulfatirhabdiaceae bacterium]
MADRDKAGYRKMKIAIISRGDASSGGAGRVAELLAKGLHNAGTEVRHIVRIQNTFSNQNNVTKRLRKIPGDIIIRNAIGIDISGIRLILSQIAEWADLLHFHDVSMAYGIRATEWMIKKVPICLTLHDFSNITGGCLNPQNCHRYITCCGNCPQIGIPPLSLPIDLTHYYFKRHYQLLSSPKVTLISPSNYLASEAKKGAGRSAKIIRIDNPVDTNVFLSDHRNKVRKQLCIYDHHKVILFVASQIDNPIKGFFPFFEKYSLISKDKPNWKLFLVGKFIRSSNLDIVLKSKVHYLGSVDDEKVLSGIYAASDCTVIPSVADNVPCIISESLSCGTPVVGLDVGGLSEMFENRHQGILLNENTIDNWKKALYSVLEDKNLNTRKEILEYAKLRYGLNNVIKKHIKLYQDIIFH